MVDRAGLENRCTASRYRGFEIPPPPLTLGAQLLVSCGGRPSGSAVALSQIVGACGTHFGRVCEQVFARRGFPSARPDP